MILKNKEYNPKIDYLLCKYLLKEISKDLDENHLKDCFFYKTSCTTEEDLNICIIRNFFLQHDLLSLDKKEIQMFIDLWNIDYSFQGFIGDTLEEKLYSILLSIKDKAIEEQEWILKFLFVVSYVQAKKEIILPYIKGIRRLLTIDSLEEIRTSISYLEKKTNRLNERHDVRLHPILVDTLKRLVPLFLEQTGYVGIGIYGSFSMGTAHAYSDLDIMVFISKELDKHEARRITKQFFCQFIPLSIDVKVTNKEEMERDLTIGMKKTLEVLGGEIQWKRFIN